MGDQKTLFLTNQAQRDVNWANTLVGNLNFYFSTVEKEKQNLCLIVFYISNHSTKPNPTLYCLLVLILRFLINIFLLIGILIIHIGLIVWWSVTHSCFAFFAVIVPLFSFPSFYLFYLFIFFHVQPYYLFISLFVILFFF